MATDKEFRDLEAVVATLRRDLRESQDTINLWRQNGLGHLDSGSGKWRYGGNTMQLDRHGIQIATGAASTGAVYFVENIVPNPENETPVAKLLGVVDVANDSAYTSLLSIGDAAATNVEVITSAGQGTATGGVVASDLSGRAATLSAYLDGTQARVNIYASLTLGLASGTNPSILSPAQITASQNDYSPTDWIDAGLVLRLNTDASWDITGLTGGRAGRAALIFNVGSFDIVLKDDNAGSTAGNRFALDGDITLAPDTGAVLWYDTITDRWRCAGRYSAGGGAGDVATDTLWDALGDLAVGTGANTANNLPVGTDGYVLTADSTDLSFGIKWAPAAGGPGGSTSIARTLMLMGA